MEVNFSGYQCNLSFGQYRNGATAISLVSVTDGSPVATATVNLEDFDDLKTNEVFIKDYSENTGMLEALIEANVVHPEAFMTVSVGYVLVSRYQLTEEAILAYNKAKGV